MEASSGSSVPYALRPGQIDEAFEVNGEIKPHWSYLLDAMGQLDHSAFVSRESKARRILRDDGATYNVYSDPGASPGNWELDLVPNLIDSEEWGNIEAGLLERAELFNLILRDIYGPRELVRQGAIPPEALFANPGFLRACHGLQIPGDHELILYAVDLMRDASGEMCVLTDRTQCPSGAGYALENRTVMSRVFPSLFRDSHAHRLAPFFQKLRRKLTGLSPNQDDPHVVVLTPGERNEAYFEHAYLANYLGFYLVQSDDLVVRNGHVWMKSLDGLTRVDVILRRVDDWYCDPVELRGDSHLGVAGLLNVARSGRVVIANPLGAGILENPVFLKYLPEISRNLLGRELRLKSVATYWAGDPDDLGFIESNLDSLVIKPVYRTGATNSIYAGNLSPQERQQLIARLRQQPRNYVAQPELDAGYIPTLVDGGLQPRPSILRSFVAASENSYTVMPGGLTRVGQQENSFLISNQLGSRSKDTWVIASELERHSSDAAAEEAGQFSRDRDLSSLPSRVVENMFWMGRYAERAESSLRLLRTVFMVLNGEEPLTDQAKHTLLNAVTAITATTPDISLSDNSDFEAELIAIILEANRPGSIRANLDAMLYCTEATKELLSSDTLRVINDIRDALSELDQNIQGSLVSAPEESLDPLVTALMALSGLINESMLRGIGWRFLDMGRRLERSLQLTKILKHLLGPVVSESEQNTLIETLLLSVEALISYRRRYRARLGVQACLDLVMMDANNPRSLMYQLELLSSHIDALPKPADGINELLPEERSIMAALTHVKMSVALELSSRNGDRRSQLDETLNKVSDLLQSASNVISDKYFDHREVSRQLVNTWEADE